MEKPEGINGGGQPQRDVSGSLYYAGSGRVASRGLRFEFDGRDGRLIRPFGPGGDGLAKSAADWTDIRASAGER